MQEVRPYRKHRSPERRAQQIDRARRGLVAHGSNGF